MSLGLIKVTSKLARVLFGKNQFFYSQTKNIPSGGFTNIFARDNDIKGVLTVVGKNMFLYQIIFNLL